MLAPNKHLLFYDLGQNGSTNGSYYLTQIKDQMSRYFIFRVYVTEIPFLYRRLMVVFKKMYTPHFKANLITNFGNNDLRDYRHKACELCL
jgi:hypothetical protein